VANPTTNYGFVLPTPTDLVTDLPADFDVALQGVDTRLKALNPSTTLGDTEYASATANTNTRLPIGSTGQVLTVASGVPSWAAIPASAVTYTTWTPTYTNFTLGNGTVVARYGTSGKFVNFSIGIQLGSTSSVSGLIKFTLPNTPKNTTLDMEQYCFTAFLDSGVDIYFGATELGTTTGDVYGMLSNGTYVSRTSTAATTPFSWTTGDVIQITGVYEEA
jgi:hypothetical protein